MILKKGREDTAMEVWEVGKWIGMVSKGNEMEIISQLEGLEIRDKDFRQKSCSCW